MDVMHCSMVELNLNRTEKDLELYHGNERELRPGARFSKIPKSFRARKATTKISNLKFTELFFSHIFNMNKFSLHAKFHAYTLLCF